MGLAAWVSQEPSAATVDVRRVGQHRRALTARLQMSQLRTGGRVRSAAVPDVRGDGRLPLPVAADGVRAVANAESERPGLVSVLPLGAGLQLVDCR